MVNRAERLQGVTERRTVSLADNFEMRANDKAKTIAFRGYPSLFDVEYEMYGGPEKGGWIESVDSKAFNRTLAASPDVVLNMNHGQGGTGLPIARTSSGTLNLRTDGKGLIGDAPDLDLRDPDVQALQVKAERKDLTQMSFAFRTIRQEWNDEETRRVLLELSLDNGDISIVTNGASPTTSFQLRGLDEALSFLAGLDPDEALTEIRSLDGDSLKHLNDARALLDRLITGPNDEDVRSVTRPADEPTSTSVGMSIAKAKRLAMLDA